MTRQQDCGEATESTPASAEEPSGAACPSGFTPVDLRSYLLGKKAGIEDRPDIRLHIEDAEGVASCDRCQETVRILRLTEPLLRARPVEPDPRFEQLIREISKGVFGSPSSSAPMAGVEPEWRAEGHPADAPVPIRIRRRR